ncbi:MAG: GntR family transcriptional regulator [Lachnospiraceae bacterium]|nr:GntR family transcriptional regulator [Lachnospiraceae bacterium]
MIWIDYTDATPIYEQIVSKYKNLIVRGAIAPNEKMPSVRALAMELSINPNTIQKAYAELERQGFVYTVKGRGNFVADNIGLKDMKEKEILQKLDAIVKEAEESGVDISVLSSHLDKRKSKGGRPE